MRPVANKQIEYFDAGLPGLVLRISYGGTKTFLALHYVNQKTKWYKLGRYHPDGTNTFPDPESSEARPQHLTLSGARDAARKFFAKPSAFLSPKAPNLAKSSFKVVAETYLEKHAAGFRSKPELERCLKKYVYPKWEDRAFASLRRSDLVSLRSDIADQHGPRQADSVFSIVRAILRWFEAEGGDDDYVAPVTRRKSKSAVESHGRERVLSDAEIKLVWNAAGDGQYGSLLKLLLLTAQPRDKVATMRWDDIESDVWTIAREPREKSNAGSLRLPPLAMKILSNIPEIADNDFVFAGRYGNKPLNSFSSLKEEIDKKLPADMPRWTLHDLRRTARTILADLNVPDRIAEQCSVMRCKASSASTIVPATSSRRPMRFCGSPVT